MKQVNIRGNIYNVAKNEFIASDKYRPIVTYNKLSEFDKEIFLLKSISKLNEDFEFVNYGDSHDSYVFKNAGKWFDASFESTKLSPFDVFSNKKIWGRTLKIKNDEFCIIIELIGRIEKDYNIQYNYDEYMLQTYKF